MDVSPPQPQAEPERPSSRRGRKPGKPLSARELASRRANLAKARAASKDHGYRRTGKRLEASRANLARAQAARRTPGGNASARLNALKHGLFASETLAGSVDRLGEDKHEFAAHLRFFERIFAPADEEEKTIVRGLAETVWRRLRFFHAQACWEKERIEKIFAPAPAPDSMDVVRTVAHANALAYGLMDFDAFVRELTKLQSQVESRLRELIRHRSGGEVDWKCITRRSDRPTKRPSEEERIDRFVEYWDFLSPAEQAALQEKVRQEVELDVARSSRP